MRVAIIGSRNCNTYPLDEIKRQIPEETSLIISGGAAGIDHLAEIAAKELSISFRKILPDYETYGKRAPLVRNEAIVDLSDRVFAFWDCKSAGTASVIAYCIAVRKPVEVIKINNSL